MQEASELIRALAALAWPLLLGALVFFLRGRIADLFDSARSRRFTVKVAGTELTMEEASEQQRELIGDLLRKVSRLQRALHG